MAFDEYYPQYMKSLLTGDKHECRGVVAQLLQNGINLKNLYCGYFKRSLYEVGDLWAQQKISVADEHLASAITEDLLTLAYPYLFSRERIGKRAVISCIANEYHQIGAKIVADMLEYHGWDTYFLGANTPFEALSSMIDTMHPDMVGLSIAIRSNMPEIHKVIAAIASAHPSLPILVGGQGVTAKDADECAQIARITYIASLDNLENWIAGGYNSE